MSNNDGNGSMAVEQTTGQQRTEDPNVTGEPAVQTPAPAGNGDEDTRVYKVVVNHEEQYSIWPVSRENPKGWRDGGKSGTKAECLDHIGQVWTDMRPLSLRKQMEEAQKNASKTRHKPKAKARPTDPRDDLVGFLAEGEHPVEASLRPEKTAKRLKEAIDRGYCHIKFTDTRGGTELGVRLDRSRSEFAAADFVKGTGSVRVVGELNLNDQDVRCVADIDLGSLIGTGHLERRESKATGHSAADGAATAPNGQA